MKLIKVCTYCPWPIKVWVNGHEWAKQQAVQTGIEFTELSNGFAATDDPAGLLSGKPAATLVDGFGPTGEENAWLARISDDGDPCDGLSRFTRAMRAAAREAINDAGRRGWVPGARVGLLHAVVISEVEGWRDFYLKDAAHRRVRDYLTLMPSTPVSLLMQEYDFHGPAMNVSAMCSSGNSGLITAKMWLDSGFVDDVVFISTDVSLTPENVEHFVRLGVGVVDTEPLDACRPFQEGSRGFPAGEAAISFVLTQRAERPYVRVLGGDMTHDAHHLTRSMHPEPRSTGAFSTHCTRQTSPPRRSPTGPTSGARRHSSG